MHYTLRIEGMTCDGCARHVTEALKSVSGVEEARVGHWKSAEAEPRKASLYRLGTAVRTVYHQRGVKDSQPAWAEAMHEVLARIR
ncbi:MAG: cation transporter [Acidobacteria bacterium]|nr:cation transporter [Acidobacteriota bacterium]